LVDNSKPLSIAASNNNDMTNTLTIDETKSILASYELTMYDHILSILASFDYEECPYAECKRIKAELNANGWDCEYGLDGSIHSVKPLTI